ncbi:MAG: hypothetical protein ACUVRM_07085 [Bacillota bacterium]
MGAVRFVFFLIVAYSAGSLLLPFILGFLTEAGLRRPNYAGREIPLGAGLVFLLLFPFLLALAFLARVPGFPVPLSLIFAFVLGGFGTVGLVDDALGTGPAKGFRGHFGLLFRERRLTSGAIKALGGAGIAFTAALALRTVDARFASWYQVLLNTVVLASSANILNLFDLRPGRAGKFFLVGLLIGAALAREIDRFGAPILLVLAVFLPVFREDLRGRLMLGDTGANFLGAALGMGFVVWLTPHAKTVAALLLVFLQLLSERYSFSALIERVSILRAFDRWGRGAEE